MSPKDSFLDFSDLTEVVAELEQTGFDHSKMEKGDFRAHQKAIERTLNREIKKRESGEFQIIDLGREEIEDILGAA